MSNCRWKSSSVTCSKAAKVEDAGIVDENVQPAEGVLGRLEQALHVRALRDVGLDRDRLAAVFQDRRDDLVGAASCWRRN